MTKKTQIKGKTDPPNAEQLLRLIAGKPSGLEAELDAFTVIPSRTYIQLSKQLGCSVYKVKKAIRCILDHTNSDFKNLDIWGRRGRPSKERNISRECLEYIINRDTLRAQCGITLAGRASEVNNKFMTNIDAQFLRKIYFKHRITK